MLLQVGTRLAGLALSSLLILTDADRTLFRALSLVLGLFVGPCQASRPLFSGQRHPGIPPQPDVRPLCPSGKATAYMGPFLVGWVTGLTGSQRQGMSTVLLFFIGDFCLMLTVKTTEQLGME